MKAYNETTNFFHYWIAKQKGYYAIYVMFNNHQQNNKIHIEMKKSEISYNARQ